MQLSSELLKQATIEYLLPDVRPPIERGKKLNFTGNGDFTVYNITAPFESGGNRYISARVEPRENEFDSRIRFFQATDHDDEWDLVHNTPDLRLQDPAVTIIGNELFMTGVEVFVGSDESVSWRTQFLRGTSIFNLKPFAESNPGNKDMRLVELPDQHIGVFTRPEWQENGVWVKKAAYIEFNSPEEINTASLDEARIISSLFLDGQEWGGVNQGLVFDQNTVGILGHIARKKEVVENKNSDYLSERQYYPFTAIFDPTTLSVSGLKIIALRDSFDYCQPKFPDIYNCQFPGGLVLKGETAEYYAGISDSEGHMLRIENPFIDYSSHKP